VATPPSHPPRSWNGEGEVLGVVPLLRAEGGEKDVAKESQFGLVTASRATSLAAIKPLPVHTTPCQRHIFFIGILREGETDVYY
jgi:hypothetical protein